MNKELCNRIGVAILSDIGTKDLGSLMISTDTMPFPYSFTADDLSIDDTVSHGEYGVRYTIDVQIIIDKPDPITLGKFQISRRCIVRVSATNGESYIIGNTRFPALVSIRPTLNKAALKLKYAGISPIFL